jgi:hypothetical protein
MTVEEAEVVVIDRESLQEWRPVRFSENGVFQVCTKTGHRLVDELHSIDFTVDRCAYFLLTVKTGSVERESFFDSF